MKMLFSSFVLYTDTVIVPIKEDLKAALARATGKDGKVNTDLLTPEMKSKYESFIERKRNRRRKKNQSRNKSRRRPVSTVTSGEKL